MANYDFNEDIHIGEQGEQVVVGDLRRFNIKFVSSNKDYRYDVLMEKNGKHVTYEIKTDVFCTPRYNNDTGNMFIEFHSRGKDSGIAVTEADWFVMYYKYLKEIWYIKTDDLKKMILDNTFRISEYSGDQGSNTKGYLIPRKEFKDWFIVRSII